MPLHLHGCLDCRLVFAHGDLARGSVKDHQCPGCGKERWPKVYTNEVEFVLRGQLPPAIPDKHSHQWKGEGRFP